jgi:hypothetical protein
MAPTITTFTLPRSAAAKCSFGNPPEPANLLTTTCHVDEHAGMQRRVTCVTILHLRDVT